MCQQQQQQQQHHGDASKQPCHHDRQHQAAAAYQQPFPWHLPIYDAHCHPTDTMESIATFDTMRTSALAIMATRSQDQHLVAQVASVHGVSDGAYLRGHRCQETCHQKDDKHAQPDTSREGRAQVVQRKCQVIPSFGWHPWFSYQIYDDTASVPTYQPPQKTGTEDEDAAALLSAKRAHYQSVLTPAPQDDDFFIASLPIPSSISLFVSSTRARLESYPIALIGEIGIDKAFRLPGDWDPSLASSRNEALTPGGREGRRLSPYKVQMQHQQMILRAQLRLAGQVGRPVSVHGVQAHGILYDTVSSCWKGHEKHVPSRKERLMKAAPGAEDEHDDDADGDNDTRVGAKPYPPRICLHSYSGSVEGLKQWLRPDIPAKIFFSFSTAVNLGTEATRAKFGDVIRAIPADKLLVESDLHMAGEDLDVALEDMYRRVCEAKGWSLEEGVRTVGNNFEHFILG
ncbi:hypothetical protein E4U14_001462 [Claviceps sp. LM454 group G7]|nr:hypothetical protein E4U14_001462 [Claviceps sp. LM454 group G7]